MVNDRNWYAIYVKSRHEFVSCGELTRKGIDTFLPSVRKMSQWKDRKKNIQVALFPGYLFVRVVDNPEAYLAVLRTKGVVTFISLDKAGPTPVTSEEIFSLKTMIESGRELDIYPHLKEGARIRVRKGPLTGAEGLLFKKDNHSIFVVNIDILGRSVGLKLCADDVEAD
jgi:transcriptional antiterminator NusG